MTAHDTYILIVGAGPVGLAAALELSRRGFRLRIIDKGAGFTPEAQSRALGVNNRTLQLLQPSGVSQKMLAEGQKASKFRVVNEQGRSVIQFDFSNAGAHYPFMLIVPQGRSERLLAEALKRYGVDVEWNTELISANADADNPQAHVRSSRGEETVAADILIGADGPGSAVRQAFGFTFDGEGYPVEFGLADIELDEAFDPEEAVVYFTKNGALGRIPMGGRVVRYVSPRPDISKALPPDLKIRQVIWRSSFNISFRHVETMCKGAVFLAGDAAHVHSPAGARGMNLGVEDACWLAWLIDEGRADEYSSSRLPAVRKVIAQTRQQTNGLIKLNAAGRFARDRLVNALLKFPPFKRAALSRITGLDTADPPWL